MFCYWHDTKAPSTYTPFLSLTENSGQNTKQLEDWNADKSRGMVERSQNLEKWLHRDKILIVSFLSLSSLVALPSLQSLRVLQEQQYSKWLKLQETSCISGQRHEENEAWALRKCEIRNHSSPGPGSGIYLVSCERRKRQVSHTEGMLPEMGWISFHPHQLPGGCFALNRLNLRKLL